MPLTTRMKPLMRNKKTKEWNSTKKVKKVIKQTLNTMHVFKPALKMKMLNSTLVACTVAGSFLNPCVIVQGDDYFQRNSDKIHITKIEFHIRFVLTANDNPQFGLLVDKEPSGALPASLYDQVQSPAQVFTNNAPFLAYSTAFGNPVLMVKNWNTVDQYRYGPHKVLTHNLQVAGATEVLPPRSIQMTFKKGLLYELSGVTGAIAEAQKNIPLAFVQGAITTSYTYQIFVYYSDN